MVMAELGLVDSQVGVRIVLVGGNLRVLHTTGIVETVGISISINTNPTLDSFSRWLWQSMAVAIDGNRN
jgi:hypothetical protein